MTFSERIKDINKLYTSSHIVALHVVFQMIEAERSKQMLEYTKNRLNSNEFLAVESALDKLEGRIKTYISEIENDLDK